MGFLEERTVDNLAITHSPCPGVPNDHCKLEERLGVLESCSHKLLTRRI